MAFTTACNFVGGENVMRQRKMCKAANESDLLVVVHTYYTNRFSRMNLLNMAKGPFFWPPSFALSLSKAEFFLDIGLRSVGWWWCYTHILRSSRKRETKLLVAGLCAAAGRKPAIPQASWSAKTMHYISIISKWKPALSSFYGDLNPPLTGFRAANSPI